MVVGSSIDKLEAKKSCTKEVDDLRKPRKNFPYRLRIRIYLEEVTDQIPETVIRH